jgi:2'-5' RNA ligase
MTERIFIAINFNSDTRSRLVALRDDIRRNSKRGAFSQPDNIHLTLIFIGDCDTAQTSLIKATMDKVRFQPFTITVDNIGRFKRGSGSLWWAGVQENKGLSDMQSDLTNRLISIGFSLDERKYSPHITLGREVVCSEGPRYVEPFSETIGSIELMRSERIDGKLTYTVIHKKEADT